MSKPDTLKYILAVVDPEYPVEVDIDKLGKNEKLFNSAIKLAERNGLYYFFVSRLEELGVNLQFLDEKRWNEELKRLENFKETLRLINEVSSESGVEYILIKDCNTIPHVPRDIDIFVRKENRAKIIQAFKSFGMRCIQDEVTETALKSDRYMRVDIYTNISYFSFDFIDGDFLFKSKVKSEIFGVKYWGLNAEANLLLTVVHSLFGHGNIKLLDFLHIMKILENTNLNVCDQYAYERGWKVVLDLALNELYSIYGRIYKNGETVSFPYHFGRSFLTRCIYSIDKLNIERYKKLILQATLFQDWIIYKLEGSKVYNLLKSIEPVRNLINYITAYIKSMRGDRKSG